jgi:hypothetical protein
MSDSVTSLEKSKRVYWRTRAALDTQMRRPHSARYLMLLFLALVGAIYIGVYTTHVSTPGNSPDSHPLGWWGWFDQGEYRRAAMAFAEGNLDPLQHFYPPLYPMAGALLVNISTGHFYFALNLAFFLWVAYVFVRVAEGYIKRWVAILLFLGTSVLSYSVLENYVIPWSSSLSAALLSCGFLGLVWVRETQQGQASTLKVWQIVVPAFALGCVIAARPPDAAIALAISLCIAIGYLSLIAQDSSKASPLSKVIPSVVIAGSIGPVLFAGFNLVAHGQLSGRYIDVASANGYLPADLLEKFISVFLDGGALYGENDTALVYNYPWMLLSFAGCAYALVRGDLILRSVVLSLAIAFSVYLPYADLLPNSIWRYLNIHYFKWTFPYFGLVALIAVQESLRLFNEARFGALKAIGFIGWPLLLLPIGYDLDHSRVLVERGESSNALIIRLPDKPIDFIDISGISGSFPDTYLGTHQLEIDGRILQPVSEFRLLPGENGLRVLFTRPVTGNSVTLHPDNKLNVREDQELSATAGMYQFDYGAHHLQRSNPLPVGIDIPNSSTKLRFQGWSDSEGSHRWSEGHSCSVEFDISASAQSARSIVLHGASFGQQRIKLRLNGLTVFTGVLKGAAEDLYISLPANLLSNGRNVLVFDLPDATIPGNGEMRKLGFSLVSLRVE